jgi:hypothetical protein
LCPVEPYRDSKSLFVLPLLDLLAHCNRLG